LLLPYSLRFLFRIVKKISEDIYFRKLTYKIYREAGYK
jgi:hypothetical protein